MQNRAIIFLLLAALLAAGIWGFTKVSTGVGEAGATTKVTVRLKWVHQAQFAGFYVAKEKGFYQAAGLDVDLQPGGSNFPAIQTVVTGGEDFGVTGADQILTARSKGADVVPLMVIYQRSPFVLFARQDSSIHNFKDIVGKKVGVKLGGNEELTYRAMLAAAGIDASTVTEVPVNIDMSPFFAGQVDVWPGYAINEPLVAVERGVPVRLFSPDEFGIKIYADTLFTVGSKIKQHPEIVSRFSEATRRGWQFAIEHPDEAAEITMKYASATTLAHQAAMMRASLKLLATSDSPFGAMSDEGWQALQQMLLKQNLLDKSVDIKRMLADVPPVEAPQK